MENEFPLDENEEIPGMEDAMPLVAMMVVFQGVLLPVGRVTWGRLQEERLWNL